MGKRTAKKIHSLDGKESYSSAEWKNRNAKLEKQAKERQEEEDLERHQDEITIVDAKDIKAVDGE